MPTPRSYRIGLLTEAPLSCRAASLKAAAERLAYSFFAASDPTELDQAVDFVLAETAMGPRTTAVPTFWVAQRMEPCSWEDDLLEALSSYDGYLTVSEAVRRLLRGLFSSNGSEPAIGFFAATPERQFLRCRLDRLSELQALRLCHIGPGGARESSSLLQILSSRPYMRLCDEATCCEPPSRLYAASGAGLLLVGEDQAIDAAVLYRLGEIVSIGALAFCPDIAWIRRHFGDSVSYYPTSDPNAAADAIDRAMAQIAADGEGAIGQAHQARAVFEKTLAADVMLLHAAELFERWRARTIEPDPDPPAPAPPPGILVNTNSGAIGSLFERVPDKALARVARSTAVLQPLQPMPFWRFGGFTESNELAAHVRYSLWLAAKARGLDQPVTVPWHLGTRLKLHLDNDLSLSLFAGGAFEPNEFALLDRVLQPGMVFVDGGANEGVYTVFAGTRVGPEGRVIAIEPSPRERARLKANVKLNRQNNVEIVEAALAEDIGTAILRLAEPQHAGQNTLGNFVYDGVQEAKAVEVSLTTLDALVAERELSRLDVLKLDLEGAEVRALTAARRVLGEMRPLIMVEVLDAALAHQGGSATELLGLLRESGYVLLTLDDATGEPIRLPPDDRRRSDNIVAVHSERDWGLLSR